LEVTGSIGRKGLAAKQSGELQRKKIEKRGDAAFETPTPGGEGLECCTGKKRLLLGRSRTIAEKKPWEELGGGLGKMPVSHTGKHKIESVEM